MLQISLTRLRPVLRWGVLFTTLIVATAVNVSAPIPPSPVVAAPMPKAFRKPDLARQIDLSGAFSFTRMEGLHDVSPERTVDHQRLGNIRGAASETKGQDIFLVGGNDIAEAVWWTGAIYGGGSGTDRWTKDDNKLETDAWVVAYLGSTHSGPQAYEIRRVEVNDRVIRVVYGRPEIIAWRTCDEAPYIVWVKLGRLNPGKYQLELINSDAKDEVVTSRRVMVE